MAGTSGDVDLGTVLQSFTVGAAQVAGQKVSMSVEFTREANATAYTVGDVVSAAAATVVPAITFTNLTRANGIGGYVVGCKLAMDDKSKTPAFRVHLFSGNTATISGDNLPYRELYTEFAQRIGYFDLPAMTTGADSTNSTQSRTLDLSNLRLPFVPAAASRTIYAVLETLTAFTPASASKLRLTLVVELD